MQSTSFLLVILAEVKKSILFFKSFTGVVAIFDLDLDLVEVEGQSGESLVAEVVGV